MAACVRDRVHAGRDDIPPVHYQKPSARMAPFRCKTQGAHNANIRCQLMLQTTPCPRQVGSPILLTGIHEMGPTPAGVRHVTALDPPRPKSKHACGHVLSIFGILVVLTTRGVPLKCTGNTLLKSSHDTHNRNQCAARTPGPENIFEIQSMPRSRDCWVAKRDVVRTNADTF